ncbi:amidase [Halorientalis sp. IM1011]|uniref:amidase n=1 Tax=Halorientalis sp. IM1011 TaxID=1932360 RepID=UPI00097CC483|nr:amidase [Halorientalis sp. IM1011]AQL42887.1 amidase [Halorientalis sp. IM1011]
MDVAYASASDIAAAVRRGDRSPVAVVDAVLDRIERRNDRLNAYAEVAADAARERAADIERAIDDGRPVGPLAGVPVALKESAASKAGLLRTMGSVPFRDTVSRTDSTVVTRLEAAGAVIVGTTNTPELDHKATTDNPLRGPTRNPFDLSRNAGGSSGGSAAAVADGLAPVAHGKDAGGSLRIPAAWSGVYAFKPTFRRVPDVTRPDGFADELGIRSTHGPITRSVRDAALVLDVIGGHHPRDPSSLPDGPASYRAAVERPIDDLTVAYTPDYGTFPVDRELQETVEDAVEAFGDAGATVEPVEVQIGYTHAELTDAWTTLVGANLAAMNEWLARHDDVDLLRDHREEMTDSLVALLESGTRTTATEYLHHHVVRTAVHDAIEDVFEEYDLLVSPTVCHPPVENATEGSTLGPAEIDGEPVDPRIGWCPTFLLNFTGHPAASVPAGTVGEGLPVGLQIAGPRFADTQVIAASAAFERVRPWADRYRTETAARI